MRKTLFIFAALIGFASCAFAQWRPWPGERKAPVIRRNEAKMTEIFPQIITVLPGDVQTFTLRSSPPPVLWDQIDFADLEAVFVIINFEPVDTGVFDQIPGE